MPEHFNVPDRRSNDAQLGYLTGRIEALEGKLEEHIESEDRTVKSIDGKLDKMSELIQKNSDQLSMYKHLVFFIRTIAICLGALLAANWSEARAVWTAFFGTELPPGG